MKAQDRIPSNVMKELKELYTGLDPVTDTFALMEVIRMISLDEDIREDEATQRFLQILYYLTLILEAMSINEADKMKSLEDEVTRLKKRAKR